MFAGEAEPHLRSVDTVAMPSGQCAEFSPSSTLSIRLLDLDWLESGNTHNAAIGMNNFRQDKKYTMSTKTHNYSLFMRIWV